MFKKFTLTCIAIAFGSAATAAMAHDFKGLLAEHQHVSRLAAVDQQAISEHEGLSKLDVAGPKAAKTPVASTSEPVSCHDMAAPNTFSDVLEQLADACALWDAGETIHICFLDGSTEARANLIAVAAEEIAHTTLKLDPRTPDCDRTGAQIHVSFVDEGYYSYVGKDALYWNEATPTLNLEGMGGKGGWSDTELGLARHEVGHMLGLLHEHQHPDLSCGFKSDEEIAQMLQISLEDARVNFDQVRRTTSLLTVPPDLKSAMMYQLPEDFYQEGEKSPCYIVGKNNDLSDGDIAFLERIYHVTR
jgi:hypothetical protein